MSFARNTGDIYGETADLNNPNFTFRRGRVVDDLPFMAKALGRYEFPLGISVSATAQRFKGFPEWDTASVSRDTVALTQVTQVLGVTPSGNTRLPEREYRELSHSRAAAQEYSPGREPGVCGR